MKLFSASAVLFALFAVGCGHSLAIESNSPVNGSYSSKSEIGFVNSNVKTEEHPTSVFDRCLERNRGMSDADGYCNKWIRGETPEQKNVYPWYHGFNPMMYGNIYR